MQPILFSRLEKDNIIYPHHLFVIRLLLGAGADINTKDYIGDSFLYNSSYYNQYEMVKIALEFKAKVNMPNEKGLTPLHAASWQKNPKIVKLLLSYGANVNLTDIENRTPLYMICLSKENESEIIQMLLGKNADLHIKAKSGLTPLELARAGGYEKILSIFLKSVAEEKTLEESAKLEYDTLKKEFEGKFVNGRKDRNSSKCIFCGNWPSAKLRNI